MNNNYYGRPIFPGTPIYSGNIPLPNQEIAPTAPQQITEFPMEQSFIENILRLNRGKKVTVFMTFPDSNEWRDRQFTGIVEQSGRDHIILSDPTTGGWYLLLMIYVDYVQFEERINYSPEFVPNNWNEL